MVAKKQLKISIPEDLDPLIERALEEYKRTAKYDKSNYLLKLIAGGMALKDLGLLEYSVGVWNASVNGASSLNLVDPLVLKLVTSGGSVDDLQAIPKTDLSSNVEPPKADLSSNVGVLKQEQSGDVENPKRELSSNTGSGKKLQRSSSNLSSMMTLGKGDQV